MKPEMETFLRIEGKRLAQQVVRCHVLHGLVQYEARDPCATASKYLPWINYRDEAEAALDGWLSGEWLSDDSSKPVVDGLAEAYTLAWQDDLWNFCMGRQPGPDPGIGASIRRLRTTRHRRSPLNRFFAAIRWHMEQDADICQDIIERLATMCEDEEDHAALPTKDDGMFAIIFDSEEAIKDAAKRVFLILGRFRGCVEDPEYVSRMLTFAEQMEPHA